jgi:hypothetical protein
VRNKRKIIKEYNPEFVRLAEQHVKEGCSFRSFSGKYAIPVDLWQTWAREIPELTKIKDEYNAMLNNKKRLIAIRRK